MLQFLHCRHLLKQSGAAWDGACKCQQPQNVMAARRPANVQWMQPAILSAKEPDVTQPCIE